MDKDTTKISFDKNYLNNLKNDTNACVEIERKQYVLPLEPFYSNDLKTAIEDTLKPKIAKYDQQFHGILIGFQNIKVLEDNSNLNGDIQPMYLTILADFYIFKPMVGHILNGIVNKKSRDHVGCLVHKTFNVSLPKPEASDNWIGHLTHLSNEVQFEIVYTDFTRKLPYIRGKLLSILSEDSGFSTSEEPSPNENQQNTITKFEEGSESDNEELGQKHKRISKKASSTEIQQNTITEFEEDNKLDNEKKRKKHKRASNQPSPTEHQQNITIKFEKDNEFDVKKNKRKRKRESSVTLDGLMPPNKHVKPSQESISETPKMHKNQRHKNKKSKNTLEHFLEHDQKSKYDIEDVEVKQCKKDVEMLLGTADFDSYKSSKHKKKHTHRKAFEFSQELSYVDNIIDSAFTSKPSKKEEALHGKNLNFNNSSIDERHKKGKHKHKKNVSVDEETETKVHVKRKQKES